MVAKDGSNWVLDLDSESTKRCIFYGGFGLWKGEHGLGELRIVKNFIGIVV